MRRAFVVTALVLPVTAFAAFLGDRECNHLDGDIAVADRHTPRGAWCAAVQWQFHWLLLVVAPAALTFALVLLAGRRQWLYLPAWATGAAAAMTPVIVMDGLRAYPLV